MIDGLKVCSKMFQNFVGSSSYWRILNASTIRIQICSFPICDFSSLQQFHQLHNSPDPVFVCFRSISLIFLAINSTVIAAVSSFGVNCSACKLFGYCFCRVPDIVRANVRYCLNVVRSLCCCLVIDIVLSARTRGKVNSCNDIQYANA